TLLPCSQHMSPRFEKKTAGRRVNSSGSRKLEASTSPSPPVCATVPLSSSSRHLRARRQKPQTDSLFGAAAFLAQWYSSRDLFPATRMTFLNWLLFSYFHLNVLLQRNSQ